MIVYKVEGEKPDGTLVTTKTRSGGFRADEGTPREGWVEYWYDTHVRVWYVRTVDGEGHQVGQAIDAFDKDDALSEARSLYRFLQMKKDA